jgi:hypothetical protein
VRVWAADDFIVTVWVVKARVRAQRADPHTGDIKMLMTGIIIGKTTGLSIVLSYAPFTRTAIPLDNSHENVHSKAMD